MRMNVNGPADQLSCDRLSLILQQRGGGSAEAPKKLAGLKLNRLVAEGFPALIRAPSMDATIRANRIEYDLATQVVRIDDDKMVEMVL